MHTTQSLDGGMLHRLLSIAALLFLGVLWGGLMSAVKFVTQTGFPTYNYVFWSLAIAASGLVAMNFAKNRKLPPRHLRFYFIAGLASFAVPQAVMYLVLEHVPAGTMGLMLATTPIITYVISMSMRVERYHGMKVAGVLMGFAGAALIIVPNAAGGFSGSLGISVAALFPPACYAFYASFVARYRPPRLGALEMSTGMVIMAAATVSCILAATEPFVPLWQASGIQITLVVYHGTVTAVSFTIFNALVKNNGALFASMSTYFVTLFGFVFGILIHDESMSLFLIAASLLILGGLGFIQRGRHVGG